MARMIPADGPVLTGSGAEYTLYHIFKEQLSDEFVVVHSVPWLTDVASRRHSSTGKPTGEVDFLILHPRQGILAIEAKGGRHHVRNHHFVHVISGRKVPVIKQARDNAHGLARWFDPSLDVQGRIGYAVALPDSSLDRKSLPPALRGGHEASSDDIVLLMADLPRIGDRVRQIMEQWLVRLEKGPLGQARLDRIVELVSPNDDGEFILRDRVYGRDERWLKLNDQQVDCLDQIDGSDRRVVLGWPGTGKTLLAVETAKRAAQRSQRCLFLTFNRLIAAHVRTQLEEIKLCEAYHFHHLLNQMPSTQVEAPDGQQEDARLRHAAQEGFFVRWDILVVDEAQALAEPWHQVLADAFKGKRVYAFCDDTQRFGFERGASSAQLCQLYQAPAFQLTYCLRNPFQISSILRQMIPPSFHLVCPRPRELTSLEEVVARYLGEELERQLNVLLERRMAPEDIVVLHAYGCPQDVTDVLSKERFTGIESFNVAAFRGMESRIVVFVAGAGLDSDLQIFSAYSRTTSHCVAIYAYWVLREALHRTDEARSRHALGLARRFSKTVESISDEAVARYRLGIVDRARKLAIGTADVYWHPDLRCWLVGVRKDEPAGHFWEHQLLQYEWKVIVLNRTEETPCVCEGRQSLVKEAGSARSLSRAECEQCGSETYHDAHSGCLSCAAYDAREVPAPFVEQLETYDRQIVGISTSRLKLKDAPGLPLSLVALGLSRLAATRCTEYSGKLFVNSGTLGYSTASTILRACIALSKSGEIDRKKFANHFLLHAEACPASVTSKQWWSMVALAFDVAVRQGLLVKTEIKELYHVSERAKKGRVPAPP